MNLETIRLSGFQSLSREPTKLTLEDVTYLISSNGSSKTEELQVLFRLFAFSPALCRVQRSDFHVPFDEEEIPPER
ncbi:TPA: hypothetical protein QH438_003096 [Klebsiella michiganensis]|nr:hypothetical protein [Klebsiella michiganensis]